MGSICGLSKQLKFNCSVYVTIWGLLFWGATQQCGMPFSVRPIRPVSSVATWHVPKCFFQVGIRMIFGRYDIGHLGLKFRVQGLGPVDSYSYVLNCASCVHGKCSLVPCSGGSGYETQTSE